MQGIAWIVVVLAALYGLHRLALGLEARGHLDYPNRKSSGGAAGAFVAMQRLIEPANQHVEQARHVEQRVEEDEASGRGDESPASRADATSITAPDRARFPYLIHLTAAADDRPSRRGRERVPHEGGLRAETRPARFTIS